jgi:beta-glucosidase
VSNRIFLDPLLRAQYPDDLRQDVAEVSDLGFIREGDEQVIAAPLDMLGVNYYSRHVVRATGQDASSSSRASAWVGSSDVEAVTRGLPQTDMGWEIDPRGLYDVLDRVQREYGPIPLYVTENGAAFRDAPGADGTVADPERVAYLDAHFRVALEAIRAGIDLRGYFVWSLMDNFEWAWGYTKRFGLIYVDYETQQRIPKDSARWFARVTRRGGVADSGTDAQTV